MTDPRLSGGRGVVETVRQSLQAGVRTVQLRDKTAPDGDFLVLARELRALCLRYEALFLVNDRVDLAREVRADGVHLGQDDMDASEARRILGPEAVIGVSVRSVHEAREAERSGADYVAANMIFDTATKTDLPGPLGLQAVRELKDSVSIPLVAIGGITTENAAEVLAAGADGLAVVSALMASSDIPGDVRRFFALLAGNR